MKSGEREEVGQSLAALDKIFNFDINLGKAGFGEIMI
jgi:hypothetical protein